MTRILVTGATGTIGAQVVRALRQQNHTVRAGARNPNKLADLAALGAETVKLDLSAPETVQAAFADVDRVFLLTPFIEDTMPLVDAALSAAKQAGVSFIVRMSAAGADPNAAVALPRQHAAGEEAVKQSGIDWAVIRPTFFADNFVNYSAATIKAQGAIYGAGGAGKAAYISSSDIGASAAAILAAPDAHRGKTYDLTGSEAISTSEAATLIGELIGREVKYVDLEAATLAENMRGQGAPEWQIEAFVYLEGIKANGWAEAVSPAVAELTGKPAESVRDFLRRHKDAFAA